MLQHNKTELGIANERRRKNMHLEREAENQERKLYTVNQAQYLGCLNIKSLNMCNY